MLCRLRSIPTRLPTALSLAWFSTTASSSNPSQAQLKAMSVKNLVEETIKDNKIAIFSKSYCPFCTKAKKMLKEKYPDVKTQIFELDQREDGSAIQQYLLEKTGQRTVPNIFVAEKHIGGYDDTFTAEKKNELATLLTAEPRL